MRRRCGAGVSACVGHRTDGACWAIREEIRKSEMGSAALPDVALWPAMHAERRTPAKTEAGDGSVLTGAQQWPGSVVAKPLLDLAAMRAPFDPGVHLAAPRLTQQIYDPRRSTLRVPAALTGGCLLRGQPGGIRHIFECGRRPCLEFPLSARGSSLRESLITSPYGCCLFGGPPDSMMCNASWALQRICYRKRRAPSRQRPVAQRGGAVTPTGAVPPPGSSTQGLYSRN